VAHMSWKNPPPAVVIGGTEGFLVGREIRKAVLVTELSGRRVVRAESDAEAVDAMTMADTFGDACLILIPLSEVSVETIREIKGNQPHKTGLLIHHDGALNENSHPALTEVHAGFQVKHNTPKSKKDQEKLAVRFARAEADSLMGEKKALEQNLAEALVKNVGTDLGVLSFEIAKMAAMARSEGSTSITLAHIRALIRGSSEIDMESVRVAMKARDPAKMAAALNRIRRNAPEDPVMLLLRARGGPADIALTWLRAALLLEKGASVEEVASRIGVPEWATKRDVVPAVQRWGAPALRDLVSRLSWVDRGVLLGSPSPWVSCESALLIGCSG
jgi:DNA polymerase III delta subunit